MATNVALMALPGRDCYTAAKGGVASMTRSMAVEYAPHKVTVNAIAPSVTLTERVKRLLSGNEHLSKLVSSHLLGPDSRSTSPTWRSIWPQMNPKSQPDKFWRSTVASRSY